MKHLFLYAALLAAFTAQFFLSIYIAWTPDLVIAVVVFAGVFMGSMEAFYLGLAAGILRGVFSVNTLPVDLFIFPLAGVISSVLTSVFYRYSAANQMFIVLLMSLGIVAAQTAYLDLISSNSTGFMCAAAGSWRTLLVTVAAAPIIFRYLRPLSREED